MRILFLSDIHGVPSTLEAVLHEAETLRPDRIVLLGDLLYHGPRNGVPHPYDPERVASILNSRKTELLAVRGNCDTEVDQMMLEFPILGDFAELDTDGRRFFLTHGHRWNEYNLPPLGAGSILAHGHTHIPSLRELPGSGVTVFNPGSISLPKGPEGRTYGFWDGEKLSIRPVLDRP
ncbi:MAG: phosphodiesterase [Kiritimatiellia bacterium]|jgi:putative phosphoesterase